MEIIKLQGILDAIKGSSAKTVEIESKNFNLKIVRSEATSVGAKSEQKKGVNATTTSTVPSVENGPVVANSANDICSQYIGFFSRYDSKSKKQYKKLRDMVKIGEPIGIVTSMGVDHVLVSEKEGKIVEFLVEEKQPVEYGQPVIRLEK